MSKVTQKALPCLCCSDAKVVALKFDMLASTESLHIASVVPACDHLLDIVDQLNVIEL